MTGQLLNDPKDLEPVVEFRTLAFKKYSAACPESFAYTGTCGGYRNVTLHPHVGKTFRTSQAAEYFFKSQCSKFDEWL